MATQRKNGEWKPMLASNIYCACGDPKCNTVIWVNPPEDDDQHGYLLVERENESILIYLPVNVWPCVFYPEDK